jgi:Flagellar biosynthesis protein, FliO
MNTLATAMGQSHPSVLSPGKARVRRSLGAWLVNRLRSRSEDISRLRVLEQLRLTARHGLVLIEVEGERFLISTSDGSAPSIYPLKNRAAGSDRRGAGEIRIEGICA